MSDNKLPDAIHINKDEAFWVENMYRRNTKPLTKYIQADTIKVLIENIEEYVDEGCTCGRCELGTNIVKDLQKLLEDKPNE